MKKIILLTATLLLSMQLVQAQRYVSEIFSNVTVTQDVFYGVNATVLAVGMAGEAIPQPLVMDVYEPEGDTETARPVVIILHTGNFVPPAFNGGCTGTHKDADVIELANRLARMGYVACAADYRLGWDPTNTDQNVRVFTLINAAYRGVQDARTAIKYMKKIAGEAGNPYKIDVDKIALWGFGTGAYISYAAATLDTITDTWIPKFVTPLGPMIVEQINGDLNVDKVGIVPPGYPGFPEGDTLCYPNHVGYDGSFQLAVQLGGALGDTSWITPNDVPMISAHVLTDPFAPCEIGIVNVPPPINLPVVEVMGPCTSIPIAVRKGVNDVFNVSYIDDISDYVSGINGDIQGFFPFTNSDPSTGDNWSFSYSLEPYGVSGSNCDTTQTASLIVMDSIVQYFAPRACLALNLGCDLEILLAPTTNWKQPSLDSKLLPTLRRALYSSKPPASLSSICTCLI